MSPKTRRNLINILCVLSIVALIIGLALLPDAPDDLPELARRLEFVRNGLLSLLIAATLFSATVTVQSRRRACTASTTGHILRVEKRLAGGKRINASPIVYVPIIEYTVADTAYTVKGRAEDEPMDLGGPVTVYYDPTAPDYVCTRIGSSTSARALTVLCGLATLIAAVMFAIALFI